MVFMCVRVHLCMDVDMCRDACVCVCVYVSKNVSTAVCACEYVWLAKPSVTAAEVSWVSLRAGDQAVPLPSLSSVIRCEDLNLFLLKGSKALALSVLHNIVSSLFKSRDGYLKFESVLKMYYDIFRLTYLTIVRLHSGNGMLGHKRLCKFAVICVCC